MNGSMNIHWGKSIIIGPLERCGPCDSVVFRTITVKDEDGNRFEINVFGNTVINNMENTNEQ